MELDQGMVTAGGLDFGYLSAGEADRPLALCLHGFPDTAWGYRHLLPVLAAAGYRAVAPFMRGYAPTAVPGDGWYHTGALARDANELHSALGGDGDAVLVGHDWGASAAYGAAGAAPERWRRVVTMAVPPSAALAAEFLRYDQIRRSFYIFFFQSPLADMVVGMDDLAFLARLWQDWSPGYDATEDMAHVREALGSPANLAAALGYYRALFDPPSKSGEFAAEEAAAGGVPPQPTLYLHGERDGCIGADVGRGAQGLLAAGSTVEVVEGAGHFLHLERPELVNARILAFLTA